MSDKQAHIGTLVLLECTQPTTQVRCHEVSEIVMQTFLQQLKEVKIIRDLTVHYWQ